MGQGDRTLLMCPSEARETVLTFFFLVEPKRQRAPRQINFAWLKTTTQGPSWRYPVFVLIFLEKSPTHFFENQRTELERILETTLKVARRMWLFTD